MRQRCGQIDRRRGLSDSAFLICNRDDGRHLILPPPACPEPTRKAREKSSRSDPATGFLYIGAAFRKPPRPRLTLRLQTVRWQGKSERFGRTPVENSSMGGLENWSWSERALEI